VLEAEKLIIRSRDGGVATLTADKLALQHANGKSSARLLVDEPRLFLSGLDGSDNARLGIFAKDDASELWLFSGNQRKAIQLTASDKSAMANFHCLKPNRMPVTVGTMGDDNTPQLSYFGPDGRPRLSMGVPGGGPGRILFFDVTGKRTLVLPR